MTTGYTFADWEALLRTRLSAPRFAHSLRASRLAAEIARAHGLPAEAAALAGLLHDFAREMPLPEMAPLARALGCDPDLPAVWHGPVAAHILGRDFGLAAPEVLSAIARHTVGSPCMTALDAVVYVADLAAHQVVPGLRALALRDLREATLAALAATLAHLLEGRRSVDPQAVRTWNALLRGDMLWAGGGPPD
jgi:predicted HD superfamily hydrolase involved in NAD metabolism